jgi:hypothetical protein
MAALFLLGTGRVGGARAIRLLDFFAGHALPYQSMLMLSREAPLRIPTKTRASFPA